MKTMCSCEIHNEQECKIAWLSRKSQRKNNAGFTLVELIVVMVLIVILAGISIASIAGYQQWSVQRQQENTAQSLFMSAQTRLNEYAVTGQLQNLDEKLSQTAYSSQCMYDGITKTSLNLWKDGTAITESSIWSDETNPNKDHQLFGKLYYIIGTPADYAKYRNGVADELHTILYDIVGANLMDDSVLDGTICMEFEPQEGLVYSILFSNRVGNFTYGGGSTSDTADISDRGESARQSAHFGYYGVDHLSKSTNTLIRPMVTDVKLNNENDLSLTFKLANCDEGTENQLTYKIKIYDGDSDEKKLLLELEFDQSKSPLGTKQYQIKNESEKQLVYANVTSYVGSATGTQITDVPFMAYITIDKTVTILLDSIDLDATEESYRLADSNNTIEIANMLNTLSLHRFFLEDEGAENIFCSVQGYGGSYKLTESKVSKVENMYFGNEDVDDNGAKTYDINTARHLYNIRYAETSVNTTKITYRLMNNVDWLDNDIYQSTAIVTNNTGKLFPSISCLNAASTLTSNIEDTASGDDLFGYTISNLKITEPKFSEKTKNPEDNTYRQGTALFVDNMGTIQNVTLKDDVIGGTNQSNVASFVSFNHGSMGYLKTDGGTITGKDHVAGICALNIKATTTATFTLDGLSNGANVEGDNYVAGVLCEIQKDTESIKTTLENCENKGNITGRAVSDTTEIYIGGLVAINGGTIQSSSSSGIVKGQNTIGGKIGGIAGYNEGNIQKCTINKLQVSGIGTGTKATEGNGSMDGKYVHVGGVAGLNAETGVISEITMGTEGIYSENTVKNMTPIMVNGTMAKYSVSVYAETAGCVGGIVGYNDGFVDAVGYAKNLDGTYSALLSGDLEKQSLQVVTAEGNVGGICGYNSALGSLDYVATPKISRVAASSWCNDNGCGGIAGYNASSKGFTKCVNNAYCFRRSGKSANTNGVGGIIGRCEPKQDNSLKLMECENYGKIDGANRIGGIVGVWKYYGGTLEKCKNEGEIYANTTTFGAGGMIGVLYYFGRNSSGQAVDSGAGAGLVITDCINYGDIKAANTSTFNRGGILGSDQDSYGTIQITNCVNIGTLSGKSSGIVGQLGGTSNKSKLTITNCRNYGVGEGEECSGIFGTYENNSSGTISIVDCYGVSGVNGNIRYPITHEDKAKVTNSKFFGNNLSRLIGDINVTKHLGTFYGQNSVNEPYSSNFDPNMTASYDMSNIGFYLRTPSGFSGTTKLFTTEERPNLCYHFTNPISLSKIMITWTTAANISNNTTRTYTYRLFYSTKAEGDDDWQLFGDGYDSGNNLTAGYNVISTEVLSASDVSGVRRVCLEIQGLSDIKANNANFGLQKINFYFHSGTTLYNTLDSNTFAVSGWFNNDNPGKGLPLNITGSGTSYNAMELSDNPTPILANLIGNPNNIIDKNSANIIYQQIDERLRP